MSTLTERFPFRVAMGFSGGAGYNTSIATVPGGKEKRNQNYANSMGRWTATQLGKRETVTKELIKFFHAAGGMANNFPFRDWTDYKVAAGEGILTGGAGTYQLCKRYTLGGITRDRKIIRPISPVVAGGGTYSVSLTTGVLTHSAGPAPTGWTGQFDVLARFGADEMDVTIVDRGGDGEMIYNWGGIQIKEDRL